MSRDEYIDLGAIASNGSIVRKRFYPNQDRTFAELTEEIMGNLDKTQRMMIQEYERKAQREWELDTIRAIADAQSNS